MKKIKLIKNSLAIIALGFSGVTFAQSLADSYGVDVTHNAPTNFNGTSGVSNGGHSYSCAQASIRMTWGTVCNFTNGSVIYITDDKVDIVIRDVNLVKGGTPEELQKELEKQGYALTKPLTTKTNNQSNVASVIGSQGQTNQGVSSNGDSGVGDIAKGVAIAGAVGAGAYVASELISSPAGKAAADAAKGIAEKATQVSAVGIEASMKELDKISDSIGSVAPKHDLRFGPTPTGDVFTFCSGPRPHRRSSWRYWYDYLCSHGQSSTSF